MNRRLRWMIGTLVLAAVVGAILVRPMAILIYQNLPFIPFYTRCFLILLLCCLCCLVRVFRGPTAPDRAVAVDILGFLIIGFSALLSLPTGRSWYIDIGIAWGLQSFIANIALAKYIEGKDFDE